MFGIELADLIRFITQGSLVVSGAASLWGAFFYWKSSKTRGEKADLFYKLSEKMGILFFVSIATFAIFRTISYISIFAIKANAHSGITAHPETTQLFDGLMFSNPLVAISFLIALVHFAIFSFRKDLLKKYAGLLFSSNFIVISSIILLTVWTGNLDKTQTFHFLHNWHSVITLGTVICVDFLYISTLRNIKLRRALYSIFPIMSAAIWIGLGLDFVAAGLIFNEALQISQQFLFNQTLIAIIIINGAALSGKINETLAKIADPKHPKRMSRKMKLIFGISGSISIVSWLTITFLDFTTIELNYLGLMAGYILLILIAFVTQNTLEKKLTK